VDVGSSMLLSSAAVKVGGVIKLADSAVVDDVALTKGISNSPSPVGSGDWVDLDVSNSVLLASAAVEACKLLEDV
jgi:hypothetical protein